MSEADYRIKIDKTLEQYFYIDREVWSVCGSKRIDYVLKCKESDVLFGLEVKDKIIHRGAKIGEYLKQASNYTTLEFNSKFDKTKIPVFISPAISDLYKEVKPGTLKRVKGVETFEAFHKSDSKHSNINSLIGSFNVGEIRKFEYIHNVYGHKWFSFIFKNMEVWRSYNRYGNERLNKYYYDKMMLLINK